MKGNWIWIDDNATAAPQMVWFRKTIQVEQCPERCVLQVSADSHYVLFLNDRKVSDGPCKGTEGVRYYDQVDVTPFLRKGKNEILAKVASYTNSAIDKAYCRSGPISEVTTGQGGFLILERESSLGFATDASYETRRAPEYGFTFPRWSGSVGYFEKVNGNLAEPLTWQPAVCLYDTEHSSVFGMRNLWYLEPSPVPRKIEERKRFAGVKRVSGLPMTKAAALLRGQECVIGPEQTVCLEVDSESYRNAFPVLQIDGAPGSQVKLLYAEGYGQIREDGSFRKGVRDQEEGQVLDGEQDVYETGDGPQTYMPFYYRTFWFIKLEITTGSRPLILRDFYYIQTDYPIQVSGSFYTEDPSYAKLWDMSLRTLRCCMHDTYMDCPYYERVQYVLDSYLEMLYTFSVSTERALPRKMIEDFAAAQLPCGLIPASVPSKMLQVIPVFSLYWIFALERYFQYTGDLPFVRKHLPQVEKMLIYFFDHLRQEDGLLENTGDWQFFDWVDGYQTGVPVSGPEELNLLYNMVLVMALRRAASLETVCGHPGYAEEYGIAAGRLAKSIRLAGYDPEEGLFSDTPGKKPFSRHAQIFAVLAGVVSGDEARQLLRTMSARTDLAIPSFCMSHFVCRAWEMVGEYEKTQEVWQLFRTLLPMKLTTCAEDFVYGRSDCHAWSAVALYECAACMLGVRPAEPGFRITGIFPQLCGLDHYGGTVPTPMGTVKVEVEDDGNTFSVRIDAPKQTELLIRLPFSEETVSWEQGGQLEAIWHRDQSKLLVRAR